MQVSIGIMEGSYQVYGEPYCSRFKIKINDDVDHKLFCAKILARDRKFYISDIDTNYRLWTQKDQDSSQKLRNRVMGATHKEMISKLQAQNPTITKEATNVILKVFKSYGCIYINCLLYTSPSPRD